MGLAMRLNHIIPAILISLVLSIHAAKAEDLQGKQEPYKVAAQRMIDKCWSISKEDRDSGVTERMREGSQNTTTCFEDHIIELSKTYLYPNNPEQIAQLQKDLDDIGRGYYGFYWGLFNEIEPCRGHCGTMNHIFADGRYAHLLEDMVKSIYLQLELTNVKLK